VDGRGKMANIPVILAALNHPSTPAATRAEALQQLQAFKDSRDAWRTCCANLSLQAATDLSTAFFFLNTLDAICSSVTRWKAIHTEGRREIRDCLVVLSRMAVDPALKRKACQVLVMVGKQEYATTWGDFADFVCLECEQDRFELMLACCELFSTEFTAGMSNSSNRSVNLRRYVVELASPKWVHILSLTMHKSPVAMRAVNALIDWVPLDRLSFEFVTRLVESSAQPATAALAMTALAQIMDRNYYPPDAERFVETVAKRVFEVLATTPQELYTRDADLTNAILGFVSSFTRRHLRKAEKYFSVPQFLEVFFVFTMNLKDIRYFLLALETWDGFIESCQEFESSQNIPSPYGAPVIGPLLWRLLERFLYCKSSPEAVQFLDRLESSQELLEEDEDDDESSAMRRSLAEVSGAAETAMGDEENEDSDLSLVVSKVIRLVQRAALLPVSSAASLGQILDTAYREIQQEAPKAAGGSRHAARDVTVLLRTVSASSTLFSRPEICAMPAIADLANWTLELIRLSIKGRLWSRGAAFADLLTQSLFCALSFSPWASMTGRKEYSEQCVTIAIEALKCQGCPEGPRLKAVALLRVISPPSLWINYLLTPTLYEFTADLTDFVRSRVYSTFALAVAQLNAPQTLQAGIQRDLEILKSLDVHRVKRSIQSLRAVVQSTALRPETAYKNFIYQSTGVALIESALGLLERNAIPRLALMVLETCFSLLRRQMGDEMCGRIVGRCLDAYPRLDTRCKEAVWGLLEKVVEENTKAFDPLLGSVLNLVLANSTQPSDMDDSIVRISRQLLVGHWTWLASQPPDRMFALANSLLKRISMQYPPDVVRVTCRAFVDSSRLLKADAIKSSGFLAQLIMAAVTLIATKERELILDDLTLLAFTCASVDWDFFFNVVFPQIASAVSLPDQVLMLNPSMAKDQTTFEEALLALCASATSRTVTPLAS